MQNKTSRGIAADIDMDFIRERARLTREWKHAQLENSVLSEKCRNPMFDAMFELFVSRFFERELNELFGR